MHNWAANLPRFQQGLGLCVSGGEGWELFFSACAASRTGMIAPISVLTGRRTLGEERVEVVRPWGASMIHARNYEYSGTYVHFTAYSIKVQISPDGDVHASP